MNPRGYERWTRLVDAYLDHAVLADAASRVKAFKMPKKEELERTIKAVAGARMAQASARATR